MRTNDRLPFKYIVLAVLACIAWCKMFLFPYWDQQLRDFYEQQKEERHLQGDDSK